MKSRELTDDFHPQPALSDLGTAVEYICAPELLQVLQLPYRRGAGKRQHAERSELQKPLVRSKLNNLMSSKRIETVTIRI